MYCHLSRGLLIPTMLQIKFALLFYVTITQLYSICAITDVNAINKVQSIDTKLRNLKLLKWIQILCNSKSQHIYVNFCNEEHRLFDRKDNEISALINHVTNFGDHPTTSGQPVTTMRLGENIPRLPQGGAPVAAKRQFMRFGKRALPGQQRQQQPDAVTGLSLPGHKRYFRFGKRAPGVRQSATQQLSRHAGIDGPPIKVKRYFRFGKRTTATRDKKYFRFG